MFFRTPITGDRLPEKTVCLTYDDGPGSTEGRSPGSGPRTDALADYLADQGIAATFFVIGERARALPDIPKAVHARGHIVAVHGESHRNLVPFARVGGDAVHEVLATDTLVRELTSAHTTFFRPPYGSWSDQVASVLEATPSLRSCIGPVLWDVNSLDYETWTQRGSVETCAARCVQLIEERDRGIVLLHDDSFERVTRDGNRALELTELLVPMLRARGFRFVRLDEVPQVATAARVTSRATLVTRDGLLVCFPESAPSAVLASPVHPPPPHAELGVIEFEGDKLALRAPCGLLLTAEGGGGGAVVATASSVEGGAVFTRVPVEDGRFALRTADEAHFLTSRMGGSALGAGATSAGHHEHFRFES